MNQYQQFWALLKFQLMARRAVLIFVIVSGVPLFLTGYLDVANRPSLEFVLRNQIIFQGLFMVGAIGVWSLASEMAPSDANITSLGSEFLLTRAVDRSVLYRSRAALFYLLVFLAPLAALIYSLKSSNLWVTEDSILVQQECLTSFPGSSLVSNSVGSHAPLISLPRGALFVAAWTCWRYAIVGLGIQALIAVLHPYKRRTAIFFTILAPLCLVPLVLQMRNPSTVFPSSSERLFFSFAGHQWQFWVLTAFGFVLIQLWSERRFCRLDQ